MFHHVTVRASRLDASRRFYETVLAPLGYAVTDSGGGDAAWREFHVEQAGGDGAVTRGLHVGFVTRSRDEVDEFWRVGTGAGYPSDGEPGPRPEYHPDYYGGFLLDPDGNSAEAVHILPREGDAVIDHLWIRVRDLEATRRFYDAVAPAVGAATGGTRPERFHVAAGDRSFALVRGEPTANVELAFPVPDEAAVERFRRAALAAGARPGRDARFVLDPDGNAVGALVRDGPA